jgi:heme A synthase
MTSEMMYKQHTQTYLAFRKTVGWIGILLPIVLMLGNYFIFKEAFVLPSISRYYYSSMHDIFVGALCSMATFMFFYSGYGKRDKITGVIAGILTLGVVFFPTTVEGPLNITGIIHYISAGLLFLLLAWMSLFCFPRKRPDEAKQTTDTIQLVCGILMLTCIAAILIYFLFIRSIIGESTCYIFIAETIALVSFGVSWLTEGIDLKREISRLPKGRPAPDPGDETTIFLPEVNNES